MSFRSLLALALLVALITGCTSTYYATRSEPIATEYDKLWNTAREVVSREYIIDEEATSKEEKTLVTKWDERLAPMYKNGKRRRVLLEVVPFEGDEKKAEKDRRWQVKLSVEMESNKNIERPLDSSVADWGDKTHDDARQTMILAAIQMEHKQYTISDSAVDPVPEMPESKDGKHTETLPVEVTQDTAWDALKEVARKYYTDKKLEVEKGKYESEWLNDADPGVKSLDMATKRHRLLADVVPRTEDGKTLHIVRVRVEQQIRDNQMDPWHDLGRDRSAEQSIANKIDEAMRRAGAKENDDK